MTSTGATSATFCATLVDEWVRAGVRHACVAPGSRSTPMALALLRHEKMAVQIFHDERSAAFAALGIGVATGIPAVVLCSSGTAGAHFYGAVIEASLSCVPMIVCTADRPAYLRDIGAPQTVDQTKMFGDAVRWFHDPGVPSAIPEGTWRALGARVFSSTLGTRPGPVHLNLPFDEPLFGNPGPLPPARSDRWSQTTSANVFSTDDVLRVVEMMNGRRGIFVAGKTTPVEICDLAAHLGWPIFADPRSGVRKTHDNVVVAFDALVREKSFIEPLAPDVVVCVGEPPASKVLSQWIAQSSCDVIQLQPWQSVIDPLHRMTHSFIGDIASLCTAVISRIDVVADSTWLRHWREADRVAQDSITKWVQKNWSEIAVSRLLSMHLQPGSHVVVSSSMPIRDFEWFGTVLKDVHVHSNRGANGIDGVISTAIGVACATSKTTYVLIGDVACVHDSSALIALAQRGIDVRIIVVNNDGGSIFSFLPQAQFVTDQDFETIYGTPHGTSFEQLSSAHALAYRRASNHAELQEALDVTGPCLIEARFERSVNVAQHDEIHRMIAEAIQDL